MKRYGEKAIREALNDGAIIRNWDWFTLQAGYKVTKDNETLGFITFDLFFKLLQDGTIVKTRTEYSYSDYAIVIKEKESTTEAPKMKNGEMKTLGEWMKELKISPVKYTFSSTGNTYDMYKSEAKKERNGYIDIYTKGGYGLGHKEIEKYIDEIFYTQNADINDVKLVQKISK